jgi:hypothetical protein
VEVFKNKKMVAVLELVAYNHQLLRYSSLVNSLAAAKQKRYALKGSIKVKPGQIEPNEFEIAIIQEFAKSTNNTLTDQVPDLHVLSLEYTGVGGYTNFNRHKSEDEKESSMIFDFLINLPYVPSGMGAVLHARGQILQYANYYKAHYSTVSCAMSALCKI